MQSLPSTVLLRFFVRINSKSSPSNSSSSSVGDWLCGSAQVENAYGYSSDGVDSLLELLSLLRSKITAQQLHSPRDLVLHDFFIELGKCFSSDHQQFLLAFIYQFGVNRLAIFIRWSVHPHLLCNLQARVFLQGRLRRSNLWDQNLRGIKIKLDFLVSAII